MNTYSDLKHTYNLTKAISNWHSRPYKVALFAALLSCFALGAFGATAPPLNKVSCGKSSFNNSGTDACSVYLTDAAQSEVVVSMSSSDPAVLVPSKTYVKPKKSTAGFTATVGAVTAARTATITATLNGVSRTYAIQLNPTGTNGNGTPNPTLSAFSCSSATMTGPGSVTCTPTLSGAAPSGGTNVSVSSSNSTVSAPSAVTVAAGATSAPFAATVSSFSTAQTVTLTATAGGVSKTFALQLSPSAPILSINATSISFGGVTTGSQATQTVTLTSSGSAAVTVNSASVTGTGFSVSGSTFPVTLNPGQTLSLSVLFVPTVAGSATGQLTINSNSSTNPTANIGLSGTGQAQSHEVDLSWNAPDSSQDPVVSYNIYRSPSGASSYTRVNPSPNAPTTFADSAVTSGQSYDYVVKSVDSAGMESAPSNSTTVAVP
jgi:Abnormal spindle-like microcephaly-assoc'd, ASPM-SPD-2-Hydin